jgi:hypothetical protein
MTTDRHDSSMCSKLATIDYTEGSIVQTRKKGRGRRVTKVGNNH